MRGLMPEGCWDMQQWRAFAAASFCSHARFQACGHPQEPGPKEDLQDYVAVVCGSWLGLVDVAVQF